MAILRHVILGEVFHIGGLNNRTRELITIVVLVTNQTLPRLPLAHGRRAQRGCHPDRDP